MKGRVICFDDKACVFKLGVLRTERSQVSEV